jgi:hypothetical protein
MDRALLQYLVGRLTTAHHLQGAASLWEPTRHRQVVPACANRRAAPWLVHALVRWRWAERTAEALGASQPRWWHNQNR